MFGTWPEADRIAQVGGPVGAIMTTDLRRTRPNKNEEAPTHRIDEDAGDIEERGKLVGMGYEDFDDETELVGYAEVS